MVEDGGGGGGGCQEGDVLAANNSAAGCSTTTTSSSSSSRTNNNSNKETTVHHHHHQQQGQGQGQQRGSRKNHRRCRRQKFLPQLYHPHNNKRIRRNTQPAPNNTNQFLMQDHDQLFHLDFEDMCSSGGHHHHHHNGSCDLHSSSSGGGPESGDLITSSSNNNSDNHAFHYSSGNDSDEDYLSREFLTTYDKVNAERLSCMSKSELLTEYQMLQENYNSLERRLKSTQRAGGGEDVVSSLCQSCGLQSNVSQSSNNPVCLKYSSDDS